MDSEWQGSWDVSPKRANKASWRRIGRELSRVGELGLHTNDPNPNRGPCGIMTMKSAQVVPNTMSIAQYMAARNGERDKLSSLLLGVEDPDIKLLHVAAEEGHKDVVMYFTKQFPRKLNQKDELYQTALHLAVRKNQVEVVRWLSTLPDIESDCQDFYHRTPLHVAASTGELQMVEVLGKQCIEWESKDLDGRTPLHYAASEGHAHVVEVLTKARGTGKPVVEDPNAKDKLGCTPLHLAAYNKEALRAFRMLLTLPNISWDGRDNDGLMPLHFAARAGNAEAVSQLQKRCLDADKSISSVWRQTPLQIAAVAGHIEVIRAIRNCVEEHDYNQLTKLAGWSDAIGRTALHYAALYGHNDAVDELLNNWGRSKQYVLDRKDSCGFTALHLAAREGHGKVVERLISASADVNAKAGSSTIQAECFRSLALREQVLQGNLLSSDFVQSQEMSALHFAARGGHILVVEELFKSQQRLVTSAVDSAGLTPLDWAKVSGNLELFLKHPVNKKLSWSPSELLSSHLKHLQDTWEMEKQESLTYQLQQVHKNKDPFQARLSFTRSGEDAKSVIHSAASRDNVKLLSQLLSLPQVNVNEQDIAGNTPTHLAARYGHVGALKVLLSHPAVVPNIKNHCQETPFHLAFEGNHVEACRMILGLFNREEENLGMLLRLAIRNDWFEMCTMLVAQKGTRAMDLQGRTDGKTPLELAKQKGSRYVELLLRKKGVRRMLLEERQGFKETADAILIASALIASITYQGWLQPPHPQLKPDDAALKCFWWLNSFSFYLAIAALLVGVVGVLPTPRTQLTESVARARSAVTVACILLTLAILCVMGAFAAAGLAVIWDYRVASLVPSVGGILLCMGILLWFASRLYRLHRMSSSWDFVSRNDHETTTTARLLDFTPVSSGAG